jgi:hypothetical protein
MLGAAARGADGVRAMSRMRSVRFISGRWRFLEVGRFMIGGWNGGVPLWGRLPRWRVGLVWKSSESI